MNINGMVLGSLVADLVAFIAVAWVAYHVIKAGVRDGIKASGLVQSQRELTPRPGRTGAERGSPKEGDFGASR
jgi:hypothetical protein